jgi:hypothetical protein
MNRNFARDTATGLVKRILNPLRNEAEERIIRKSIVLYLSRQSSDRVLMGHDIGEYLGFISEEKLDATLSELEREGKIRRETLSPESLYHCNLKSEHLESYLGEDSYKCSKYLEKIAMGLRERTG